MKHTLLVIGLCTSLGCSSLLPALQAATQGAQFVGSLLDLARSKSDAFLERYPDAATQWEIARAEARAREALTRYNEAVALGRDLEQVRTDVLVTYEEYRRLLESRGIPAAKGPTGGAESDAPAPEPFRMPSVDEVGAALP